ncbi:hypothetical protein [Rhodococcus sp. LB1]|uniref:hypothetical protein n=1 Tax=Rhodococcus sp. LB1 TaxID=1807499 RepID=UPI00077A8A52|nr:hypothetical protein [Rhodococcus sp. LB1]KXX59429.1 hypothetical protein AZG88_41305 [Rhodococcus sp. LB1]
MTNNNFTLPWSWLSEDQRSALAANPGGPVPPFLVQRLKDIGLLGIGSRHIESAGGWSWYLPHDVVQFIREQSANA